MSEQLHMTNKTPNESETAVFTSPDGKNILEATRGPESTTESKLGNTIVRAAERINKILISGVEFRDKLKDRFEASDEAARDKLRAFGSSALLVCDTAIGFGLFGVEAASKGVGFVQEKVAETGHDIKEEYKDFKDTIDFAKKDIKENIDTKVNKVRDVVFNKVELISNFKNEKVCYYRRWGIWYQNAC